MCFKLGMQKTSPSSLELPLFRELFGGMISARRIEEIASAYHSGLGAPPKVPVPDLILAAVYHQLMAGGTKAQHLYQTAGQELRDASLSERFQTMDLRIFEQVMDAVLQPQARPGTDPEAFYAGLLLLGVDGGAFSLPNTPSVKQEMKKAATRRGEAAFAKLQFCALNELALHNPIAASIGTESEMVLARRLWGKLPRRSLLIADRYYGTGQCIGELVPLCLEHGGHFLFRVKDGLKARILRRYADSSALVRITSSKGVSSEVREIRGKVTTRSGRKIRVRLWTSLTDAHRHTARKLLRLYSLRWEQEISFDELKNKLHGRELLRSHTLHTAIQELAALIMAQAVLAQLRRRVARGVRLPTLRVSFGRTRHWVEGFWSFIELGSGLVSRKQIRGIGRRLMDYLGKQLTPPRRSRACPRAVRQPVRRWPRLQRNVTHRGDFKYEVIPV
jgi:hypothetical protein